MRLLSLFSSSWVTCCVLMGSAAAGWAQEGLPLGFEFQATPEEMTLTVSADDFVEDIRVEITSDRGTTETQTRESLAQGDVWTLDFPAPTVTTTYTVVTTGLFAGMEGSMEFSFPVEVAAPLEFEVDTSTYDRDAHSFVMRMNQPAGHVDILVRGDQGEVLAQRTVQFDGQPANAPLNVQWSQGPGNVMTIEVTAHSTNGVWASRRYIPWYAEFEPIYINFATGSAEVPESDFAMLRERLAQLVDTATRVSEHINVQLYVAGYTDTVGSPADNQRLSEERARSIGRWVQSQGWSLPVSYQGFGEDVLAVDTSDNVDESRNRRALFILGTADSPTSSDVPRTNWRRLNP
jgi:outer membrane protein OmpA-like peptidoglycan-associated protein